MFNKFSRTKRHISLQYQYILRFAQNRIHQNTSRFYRKILNCGKRPWTRFFLMVNYVMKRFKTNLLTQFGFHRVDVNSATYYNQWDIES